MGINSIYEILCSIIYRKMNKIGKAISFYIKISLLQSFHTVRYIPKRLFSPCHFHFSQDNNKIQQTMKLGAHSQYTQNLKDIKWVNDCLIRIQYLLGYTNNKNLNYAHLRSVINELLSLCRHVTNARHYHSSLVFDIQKALNLISQMIRLTFSEMSNQTHENIDQEGQNTYQFIQCSVYFHICDTWNTSPDRQVLSFYLNSYMNLLFDRNFLKYITVFDVLRQGSQCETRKQIINRSVKGIAEIMRVLKQKMDKVDLLNPYEMAVYLKFLRNNLYAQKTESEKEKDLRILANYILKSPKELDSSLAHCQNLTYSIYILFTIQEMKGPNIFLIFQWISQRMRIMITSNLQDYFLQYLIGLTSHEDKLTCLKVEIWLDLLNYQKNHQIADFNIRPPIQSLLLSIHELSFQYWRCKYFFWLMDSFLNKYHVNCLPLIKKIGAYLPQISFRKHDKINSAILFLTQITKKYKKISDISDIHASMASWLCNIPHDFLKNQNPSDLCDILTLADEHPSLQKIYTPYLAVLLQLSLGHFPWTELNRIYYYGLRFEIQAYSQESQWNMQYVRRYILNQYAAMGLLRRQIPQDSYFYKIIGITTPQKFYKNYLKNE